ncbi:DinB/UmuC family translesion DNA polymerase [Pantoea ananatis]|uniref:DinB/UmuC family translesion DNA polymerase n=1 Tax=Pantoea ananas TaxID=553 RepID=UPI003FA466E6
MSGLEIPPLDTRVVSGQAGRVAREVVLQHLAAVGVGVQPGSEDGQRVLVDQLRPEGVIVAAYQAESACGGHPAVSRLRTLRSVPDEFKRVDKIVAVRDQHGHELNGESCMALEDAPPPKQQIVCSRSFGQRIDKAEDMQHAVCTYAVRAAEKLREQGSRCRHVSVFIATSRYATEPQYGNARSVSLLYPTSNTRDIVEAAQKALAAIWREGYRFARAGIMLGDFYTKGVTQLDLFSEQQPRAGGDKLMAAIDRINSAGRGQVYFAGQGRDNDWQMKREHLSPRYTTCLSELLLIDLSW